MWIKGLTFFCRSLVRCRGLEILKRIDQPVIFAMNHNNYTETLLVPAFLMKYLNYRKICFVIDWMFRYIPLAGWFTRQVDPVWVYGKRARFRWLEARREPSTPRQVKEECLKRLKEGKHLGIFPEGRRNHNPRYLLRGQKGIGHLVLESDAPVVPVGIDFEARRKKNKIPFFGKLYLSIGEPLNFHEIRESFRQESSSREERHRYASLITGVVMEEISRLSGKGLHPDHLKKD